MNANIRSVQKRQKHIAHRLKSVAQDARRCEELLCRLKDSLQAPTVARLSAVDSPRQPGDQKSSGPSPLDGDDRPPEMECFANLRCGEWYLPRCSQFRQGHDGGSEDDGDEATISTRLVDANWRRALDQRQPTSCYFKSSDGHYGQWNFSASRVNAHLLRDCLVSRSTFDERNRAKVGRLMVIVDATQHGKKYPDALSKTIPVWATVMNAAYSPRSVAAAHSSLDVNADRHCLLPPWLHPSEANAILARVPRFLTLFEGLESSRHHSEWCLSLPLTVKWLHAADLPHVQQATFNEVRRLRSQFHVLLLLCASGDAQWQRGTTDASTTVDCDDPETSTTRSGWVYVPGAGDDHQSWGRGLTPRTFWLNEATLNNPLLSLDEVEEAVDSVVLKSNHHCALPQGPPCGPVRWDQWWEAPWVKQVMLRQGTLTTWDVRCLTQLDVAHDSTSTPHPTHVATSASGNCELHSRVLIVLQEAPVRTLVHPTIHHLDTYTHVNIQVNSKATKHGIQRAISWLLLTLGFSLPPPTEVSKRQTPTKAPETTTPESRCVLLTTSGTNVQLLAALSIALRVAVAHHLDPCDSPQTKLTAKPTKATIRAHQASVVELLGPESTTRRTMIQINRAFLSN